MPKIYKAKRFGGKRISNLIKDLPVHKRGEIKAQEMAKVDLQDFSLNGVEVKILEAPQEVNGCLSVSVSAKRGGVDLKVDNPIYFQNPPIMVHNGTFYQEYDPIAGGVVDKKNFVEDPEQALKEIIVQTLELLN